MNEEVKKEEEACASSTEKNEKNGWVALGATVVISAAIGWAAAKYLSNEDICVCE